MSIFGQTIGGAGGQATEEGEFRIDRSLRFNSADSAYLNRTPSSVGNVRTWTFSCWVKRCQFSDSTDIFSASTNASNRVRIRWTSTTAKLQVQFEEAGTQTNLITNARFRDLSAWYHIVIAVDTTQSTAADRVKVYVNNDQLTNFDTEQYPIQNYDTYVNAANAHGIGSRSWDFATSPDYYLAETILIDGQALVPTDFGEYDDDNNWNPKDVSGLTFGTNGFKLSFSDNTSTTTIAEDSSGNNNDWTANNFSVASGAGNDSLIDTPMNYEASSGNNDGGNYATLNALITTSGPLSNGNLEMVGASAWRNTKGTISVSSGKWYFEATYSGSQYGSAIGNLAAGVGFAKTNIDTPNVDVNTSSLYGSILAFSQTGHVNNFNAPSSARSQIADGDVIGLALDLDAGSYVIYVNNTSTSSGSLNFTGELTPWVNAYYSGSYFICNFGQRPFTYTPPTNHLPLVTTSLSDPTIADPSTEMDVALWTGNSGTQTISGLDFSPHLVWGKCRSHGSTSHHLYDIVRTAGQAIFSNASNAEVTYTNYLTAFTSDGFTLGNGSELNFSSRTFVGWSWHAGGEPTTDNVAGAGNVPTAGSVKIDGANSTTALAGSIAATRLSANTSAGFSIVSYTGNGTSGSTLAHGLNANLGVLIIKSRSIADDWFVAHNGAGTTGDTLGGFDESYTLFLNTAAAKSNFTNAAAALGDSSVFAIADGPEVNQNSATYIAYCFSPIDQYSSFGSFEGNGSSDGPFVYTGFRSRWIMFKNADSVTNWLIYDSARNTFNVTDLSIQADETNSETAVSNDDIDILSNGFKIRATRNDLNGSGHDITYMAFSQNPFKTARAR